MKETISTSQSDLSASRQVTPHRDIPSHPLPCPPLPLPPSPSLPSFPTAQRLLQHLAGIGASTLPHRDVSRGVVTAED